MEDRGRNLCGVHYLRFFLLPPERLSDSSRLFCCKGGHKSMKSLHAGIQCFLLQALI